MKAWSNLTKNFAQEFGSIGTSIRNDFDCGGGTWVWQVEATEDRLFNGTISFLKTILVCLFVCLYKYIQGRDMHISCHICKSQRTNCMVWLFFTTQDLRIELRLSAWWQVLLPIEPSCQPNHFLYTCHLGMAKKKKKVSSTCLNCGYLMAWFLFMVWVPIWGRKAPW